MINTIQINYAARHRAFLRHAELAGSPFAPNTRDSTSETVKRISLSPDADILPGWKLTLDVAENGYWFLIKDTMDPCGFAVISNQEGVIFTAEPIR